MAGESERGVQSLVDRFRTAVDRSDDLFIILDARLSDGGDVVDFSVVDLNQKAKTLFSPGTAHPVGRLMSELVPDFATGGRLDLYTQVVASRTARENEFFTESGPFAGMHLVERVVPLSDGVAVTGRDVTRHRESERRLKEALLAKESLLREVHHRVKNNLQLLLSTLNLQADLVSDPRTLEIIQDIRDRLRSIATVHQRLSQSLESGRVDLEQYLRTLVHDLFRSHKAQSAGLRYTVELPPIELHGNDVMVCGLVVNELVTNAIKHGFPGGRQGQVCVVGKELAGKRLSIMVADDGIGFPQRRGFAASTGLGLRLVHILADQLKGKVDLRPGTGTQIELTFDLDR
jgi:two-component sensor histidine kinase